MNEAYIPRNLRGDGFLRAMEIDLLGTLRWSMDRQVSEGDIDSRAIAYLTGTGEGSTSCREEQKDLPFE